MITIYDKDEEIKEVVNDIHKQQIILHNFGSMLNWWHNPETIKTLAIAEVNNEKVGAVIVTKDDYIYNIGVYVNPSHRKKGIGGKLLQSIKHSKEKFLVDKCEFRTKMFSKYLEGKI